MADPLSPDQQRAVLASLAYWQKTADDRMLEIRELVLRMSQVVELLNELTAQIEGTAERCPASAGGDRCLRRAGHNDDHTTGAIRWSG
jgi:hypothetical protein